MKNNNRFLFILVPVLCLVSVSANAALVSRLGGQAVYDTDLNVTWLADANYAMTSGYIGTIATLAGDGRMDWNQAVTWAAQLTYAGYADWRLTTVPQVDPTCSQTTSFPTGGSYSNGNNCTGNEMGHLFYNELGVAAGSSILSSASPDLSLFTNIKYFNYWSGSEFSLNPAAAWFFNMSNGTTDWGGKDSSNEFYAWAVRDGDVAVVPVPAAAWLFGSGLIGMFGFMRRKC
jgi:hypothetical protein